MSALLSLSADPSLHVACHAAKGAISGSTAVPRPKSSCSDANEANQRLRATCVDEGPDCLMSLELLSIAIRSILRIPSQQSGRLMGDG